MSRFDPILIVDDDDTFRDDLKATLEEYGFTDIYTAANGDIAVEFITGGLFRRRNVTLLTDVQLPHRTGDELVRLALARGVSVSRIGLYSGYPKAALSGAVRESLDELESKHGIRLMVRNRINDLIRPIVQAGLQAPSRAEKNLAVLRDQLTRDPSLRNMYFVFDGGDREIGRGETAAEAFDAALERHPRTSQWMLLCLDERTLQGGDAPILRGRSDRL
jgi:CheY-like chemotaxis protein